MIYWEKIEIDGKEVLNIVNPNVNIETNKNQNLLKGLSSEQAEKFKNSIPKNCFILPLYVNKTPCISKGEN